MEGYVITFFTQHEREYMGLSVGDWIVKEAKQLGIRGATLFAGKQGFGHDGRFHSENYFDNEDNPILVTMAISKEEYVKLLGRIQESHLRIFYTKYKAEFRFTCDSEQTS